MPNENKIHFLVESDNEDHIILYLFDQFLCAFEDGVTDFAFEALFGHGYTCRTSDFLLGLRDTDGTLPRECETRDFHIFQL